MATAALIPISEYLRTSYEPDAEYVDGVIEERCMGERDHGDLQGQLYLLLRKPELRQYFKPVLEWRVQVGSTRFRVPDLALCRAGLPKEQIAQTPPLLCIEVLSPEDTMSRTLVRVRDFLAMGVPEVWIVDSQTRSIHVCKDHEIVEITQGSLKVPETPVFLALAEIFSILDEE